MLWRYVLASLVVVVILGVAGDRKCVNDQLTSCPVLDGTFTVGGAVNDSPQALRLWAELVPRSASYCASCPSQGARPETQAVRCRVIAGVPGGC